MSLNQHSCIRPGCDIKYQDTDVDAYYCPACNTARKQAAAQLDKKFDTKSQTPNGLLAQYDAARTFIAPNGERKTRAFPLAKDLFKI